MSQLHPAEAPYMRDPTAQEREQYLETQRKLHEIAMSDPATREALEKMRAALEEKARAK